MRTTRTVLAGALGALVAACSSTSPNDAAGSGGGVGPDAAASSASGSDARTPHDDAGDHDVDGGTSIVADGGNPSAAYDGGHDDPVAPKPPAGATACGAGSFTLSDATTSCQSGASSIGLGTHDACGAATAAGGEWQAWCTGDATYFWAKFGGVAMQAPLDGCSYWMLQPYLGSSGGGTLSTFATPTMSTELAAGAPATDVALWTTLGPAPTSVSFYLAAQEDAMFCGIGSPGAYVMLGASLETQ